ncbi:unnamed protein product [Angiostrongylus costaricensis]|uniref:Metalloendopeptidase n=1 Tax=Angiostrongylus costaricensis TaxID=334426 RepID=A0A0R3PU63_ANGCS|nr:unnamed protein product [Angiostrongylus costaricensis]
MWSSVIPLLVVLWSTVSSQPNFLTNQDFINAARIPTTGPRMRPLFNDQRFSLKLEKPTGMLNAGEAGLSIEIEAAEHQRAVIARAIASYQAKTCIRFVPKTPMDFDYIVISKLDGCYADFARVGGPQQVSLADECINYPTIIHELMHVIGFIHEHQREDRDSYVEILYQNIIPGASMDFDKLSMLDLSYYGEDYDYLSIMHYERDEGSKNGQDTIEPKVLRSFFHYLGFFSRMENNAVIGNSSGFRTGSAEEVLGDDQRRS